MIYAKDIKNSIDLRSALEFYGLRFNKKGFALCPFHAEKTPSFAVNGDFYYCFGCNASGDIIDFVQNYFNLTFPEALEKINDDFSLGFETKEISKERKLEIEENIKIDKAFSDLLKKEDESYSAIYDYICNVYQRNIKDLSHEDIPVMKQLLEEKLNILDLIGDSYISGNDIYLRMFNDIRKKYESNKAQDIIALVTKIIRLHDKKNTCSELPDGPLSNYEKELNYEIYKLITYDEYIDNMIIKDFKELISKKKQCVK